MQINSSSTDTKIHLAFSNVLSQKTFSAVKAIDIIRESKISHQTFYRFYQDKYDLAESFCVKQFSGFMHVQGKLAIWKDIVISILHVIKNNPVVFKHILTDHEGAEVAKKALNTIAVELTGGSISKPAAAVHICVMQEWIHNRYDDPIEDVYRTLIYNSPINEFLSSQEIEKYIKEYENLRTNDFRGRERPNTLVEPDK